MKTNVMKTKLVQIITVLLLGSAVTIVDAASNNTTPPPVIQTTALAYGGAMQTTGRCSIFNAGSTEMTVVDVHAEDGQGNVLVARGTDSCADKVVAGLRACTVSFDIAGNDSAVCIAKIALPALPKTKAVAKANPPPLPPSLTLELLDNAGNVLVHTDSIMPPPPPLPPAQNANKPAKGGMPSQDADI